MRHELASALWQSGLHERAREEYRALAEAYPHDLTLQFEFGYVLRNTGRYLEAIGVLESALAIETRAEIHVELARCYRAVGRVQDADAAVKRALTHSPDHPEALLEEIRAAAEKRQWIQAIDTGLELMASQPTSEVAYITAVGLAQSGRSAEAEAVLRKGLELERGNADLLAELAVVLIDQGKLLEARRHVGEAMALHPDDYHVKVAASHVLLSAGESRSAMRLASEAVRMNPDAPETHFAVGSAHLELEDGTEALAAFRHAVDLTGGFPHAQAGMAASLCMLGRHRESLDAFSHLLAGHPEYFSLPSSRIFRRFYERARSEGSEGREEE